MVMKRINDRDEPANKAAENNEIERTSNPGSGRDLLAEVAETDASVIANLPNGERAAVEREMMSGLQHAATAAKRLADLPTADAGEEGLEVAAPEEEGPITEPTRPHGRSLAFLSDGNVALNVTYLEGADLTGYERWEGIILSPEQADEATDGLSDAADDVAANIGGAIRWKKKGEPEGSGSDGQ
jgi:hypothetical protein